MLNGYFLGAEEGESKGYTEFSLVREWMGKTAVCVGIPILG
jgi:hypothetical protein